MARYNITGIAAFAAEMKDKGLGVPKVSLQFELSNSGITQLVKAEAAVEETYMGEEVIEVDDDSEDVNVTSEENVTEIKEEEIKTKEENKTTEEEKVIEEEETNKDNSTKKEDKKVKEDTKKKKEDKKKKEKPKKKKKITVEKVSKMNLSSRVNSTCPTDWLDFWFSQSPDDRVCIKGKEANAQKDFDCDILPRWSYSTILS